MKEIAYSRSSLKVLRRLPANQTKRIVAKIEQYAKTPASLANNVKRLTGSSYVRLRVGDWRVIMDDRGNVLDVLNIGPRGSVYE